MGRELIVVRVSEGGVERGREEGRGLRREAGELRRKATVRYSMRPTHVGWVGIFELLSEESQGQQAIDED